MEFGGRVNLTGQLSTSIFVSPLTFEGKVQYRERNVPIT